MARARSSARLATALGLRALAALVALLLLGSSLGQIAHFIEIQHAICEEHGELVELRATHAASEIDPESGHGHEQPEEPQNVDGHDHCQQLAQAQRDLATPPAPALGIAPAAPLQVVALPAEARRLSGSVPLLALAPKTSPPCQAPVG